MKQTMSLSKIINSETVPTEELILTDIERFHIRL